MQVAYTYGTMIVSERVAASAMVRYYGYDAHGNVAFLTDAGGAVTDTYRYDAWGNVLASTGVSPNSRLFAGQEFDTDLGLINMQLDNTTNKPVASLRLIRWIVSAVSRPTRHCGSSASKKTRIMKK